MQRHDVASTLRRRYIYVMCLPGTVHYSMLACLNICKGMFILNFILAQFENGIWLKQITPYKKVGIVDDQGVFIYF